MLSRGQAAGKLGAHDRVDVALHQPEGGQICSGVGGEVVLPAVELDVACGDIDTTNWTTRRC